MKLFLISALLCFSASTVSCANPNYSNETTVNAQAQNNNNCNANCSLNFVRTNIQAQLSWNTKPVVEDESPFTLRFSAPPGAAVSVRLFMPSMGHGSAPIKLQKVDEANYNATNVYFTMAGNWELIVSLKQGNQLVDQAVVKIEL